MLKYILKRLFRTAIVLVAVSILVFLLVYLTGDPVATMLPLSATPEEAAALRAHFGLDKPVYIQYLVFVKNALHGDLGNSFKYRMPAIQLVLQRLPATITLAVISTLLGTLIGVPLAIIAASHENSIIDFLISILSFLSISTPNFWFAIILILLFSQGLMWLPPSGKENWKSFVMPAMTMSLSLSGTITRLLRRELLSVMQQDFIETARSKGLKENTVFYVHALKNALIPTVTIIGLNFGELLGGSVIVESVFAWPGVGWLLNQAITARDLPLVRAGVLVLALLIALINLLVDISYCVLDPRIRLETGDGI